MILPSQGRNLRARWKPIGQSLLALTLVISTLLVGPATPDRTQARAAGEPLALAAVARAAQSSSQGQQTFVCHGGVELAPTMVQHIDPRLLQMAQEKPEQL